MGTPPGLASLAARAGCAPALAGRKICHSKMARLSVKFLPSLRQSPMGFLTRGPRGLLGQTGFGLLSY